MHTSSLRSGLHAKTFGRNRKQITELIAKHGGRYVVRGGVVDVLEGCHDGRRLAIAEFPSMGSIRAFWNSLSTHRSKSFVKGSVLSMLGRCPVCDSASPSTFQVTRIYAEAA